MLPLTSAPVSATSQSVSERPDPLWVRTLRFLYVSRHKFATAAAIALAVLIGWHAVFGPNGVVAYRAKRQESVQLAQQIAALQKENARLAEHNTRLQKDPEAIEGAIRSHLRYAKPNEVIVTVDPDAPAVPPPAHAAAPSTK